MVTRAGMLSDRVDAQYAQGLFDAAAADPLSELAGDLAEGFAFWRVVDGVRQVRVHVVPVGGAD